MNKMTKLLSLVLTVAMMLSLAIPSAFAIDFSDVPENYQYYDAVQSLVSRGIINGYTDGTFKPEATITRAEFAKMVIYAIGLGNMTQDAATTGFPDVATDHWAAGVIKTAYDLQIINGFDDGTFKPDENVTYDQALKMAVCAKYDKFGEIAMKNGGYPTGYRKVAGSYGFVKGITDGVYEEPAKRGTIAQLMNNMLGIKLADITDDPTAVETNQMLEVKGQVVSVYGASLDSTPSSLTKYQISIQQQNGAIFTYNAANIADSENLRSYLGKMVTAYYTEDMSLMMQNLSSLSLQRGKNGEVTVDMSDVIHPATDSKLSYHDAKGDVEEISVSNNAKILYNGSLVPSGTTFSSLVSANENSAGTIRFLSTGGIGDTADVVFLTVYSNYLVTSTNASTKAVYLDNGSKVESKIIDDESKSVTITQNGTNVGFSAIKKGQIVSISEDLNGNFMEVLVGPTPVEGKVSSMTRDEGKITIGSKVYSFAPGVTFGADIVAGANLKIYLDAFNKIAKYEFKATAVAYNYAYLTRIKNIGNSLSADIRAELIDLKSTSVKDFSTYPLAETVKINNVSYQTATDFAEIQSVLVTAAQKYTFTDAGSGKVFGAGADEVYQPIKYTLVNGKIDSILIGKDNATEADLRVDASILNTTTYASGIKCTTSHTGLAGIYTLTSSTKVLYVSDQTKRAFDDYTVKSGNNSGLVYGDYYRLLLVDINASGTPAIVIVYNIADVDVSVSTSDWINNTPMVVTMKSSVENYNNITVQGYSGSEVVYHDEGTTFFNQVNIGDVIRVAADSNNVIETMEVVAVATDIFNGTDFIKLGAHQAGYTASQKVVDGGTGKLLLIREGDDSSQDKATMSTMAGTVYSVVDSKTFKIALDYVTDPNVAWNEISLGNEERLKSMSVSSSTKVIAVNIKDGAVQSVDTEAVLEELIPYTLDQTSVNPEANRVFVYRSGSSARMIVVFRAQ